MKYLYLVRHAKSSWKNPDLDDIDRPLNKRGKRDAPFMANLLAEDNTEVDLLITSPAKRARKTAKIIAEAIGYPKDKIVYEERVYEADETDLLNVINGVSNDVNKLMIVGHNPALTLLNNFITDKRIDNIPTCGIAFIELNVKEWKDVDFDNGKLLSFDYPKKYFKKND